MVDNPQIQEDRTPRSLINHLSILLRNLQIHDPNNTAVRDSIEKFMKLVTPVLNSEKELRIDLIGEYFYLNNSRVKFPLNLLQSFDFLISEFKKRRLGSIIFGEHTNLTDIQSLIMALLASSSSGDPLESMETILKDVDNIWIEEFHEAKETQVVDKKKGVTKAYYNVVSCAKSIAERIKTNEKIEFKKAKRAIEPILDLVIAEEPLLYGMTAIKDYDEYTYYHSVNVCIFCVTIGQKLGLSRKALRDLGIVGLFHDIGKTHIPVAILNKPGKLNEYEWKIMKKHPFEGFREIIKMRKVDQQLMRMAMASLEHHIKCDLSGYPSVKHISELNLYSKIVSIADQYDAMTSARVYSREPKSPNKTLTIMVENAGSDLDPVLLKVFLNIVGTFPIGSFVSLNTKEVGFVQESNKFLFERPKVLIIFDSKGQRIEKPFVKDLSRKDEQGRYLGAITRTLDPKEYNISYAEYILN
ncbi:MAG TPA: HD domain-containing phosphohydrolase [Nitrospinota bacterium]|nr:HD domain-containing phosphohydrolase [Nitrospinota bacterium]